jgi:hypothetical protein
MNVTPCTAAVSPCSNSYARSVSVPRISCRQTFAVAFPSTLRFYIYDLTLSLLRFHLRSMLEAFYPHSVTPRDILPRNWQFFSK